MLRASNPLWCPRIGCGDMRNTRNYKLPFDGIESEGESDLLDKSAAIAIIGRRARQVWMSGRHEWPHQNQQFGGGGFFIVVVVGSGFISYLVVIAKQITIWSILMQFIGYCFQKFKPIKYIFHTNTIIWEQKVRTNFCIPLKKCSIFIFRMDLDTLNWYKPNQN